MRREMFKSDEWVVLVNLNVPAQYIRTVDNWVQVKLQDGEIMSTDISNIKKKKNCSCNKSKKYPFCDGSHAG